VFFVLQHYLVVNFIKKKVVNPKCGRLLTPIIILAINYLLSSIVFLVGSRVYKNKVLKKLYEKQPEVEVKESLKKPDRSEATKIWIIDLSFVFWLSFIFLVFSGCSYVTGLYKGESPKIAYLPLISLGFCLLAGLLYLFFVVFQDHHFLYM
jgi:hypothetical protein